MKKKVFITPTTHWDREWVMTFGQYQVRLVNLVDHLIEILGRNPEYCFLLDGQSIVLEDYLEIKPEQKKRISAFLKNGQMVAGPWYVLADQFLQNGESTIRNLTIGMKVVEKLGGRPMMLGYVPDSFGSIAALPMILAGFNIRYTAFGRGRPYWGERLPHYEFWCEGPDGSEVLAANHGYENGVFLSYPDIWTDIFQESSYNPDPGEALAMFLKEAENQCEKAATENLYFSVGIDHMEARESLTRIIEYINGSQEKYQLVYGLPEDYLKAVGHDSGTLCHYTGEMRSSEENFTDLADTLSSRMYLKQANDACELLLQRAVEPLWTMASALSGTKYPAGHLAKMWKLLLSNHPHDSICGCSLDQVHRDMVNRYEQIESIGSYLVKDGLNSLLAKIATTSPYAESVALTMVNPLGYDYTGPVKGLIRIPGRFKYDNYTLVDSAGETIAARIRHCKDKQKDLESVYMTTLNLALVLSKDAGVEKPDDQVFTILEVDFAARDIPGMGYKTFWIRPGTEGCSMEPGVKLRNGGMENEWLKVDFNSDGTMNILDKSTGHEYYGLNHFVDREDAGNAYGHHGFPTPEEYDTRKYTVKWSVYEAEPHRISCRAVIPLELPGENEGDGRSPNLKNMPLTLYATLYAGVPRLDMTVELDNTCRDHCLRAAFETGLRASKVSAYDHFNVIEREAGLRGREWRDEPFQEFIDVTDGIYGLSISSKGLPAYEAIMGEKGILLYLTLLRCVGSLGPAAGANYTVPEAQCQGKYRFEYSIIPHKGGWYEGECLRKAVGYRSPVLVEADLQHDGALPSTGRFVEIESEKKVKPFVSSLKQAEDGDGSILRLWNPGGPDKIKLKSSFEIISMDIVNLDETVINPSEALNDTVILHAQGLTTLRIKI